MNIHQVRRNGADETLLAAEVDVSRWTQFVMDYDRANPKLRESDLAPSTTEAGVQERSNIVVRDREIEVLLTKKRLAVLVARDAKRMADQLKKEVDDALEMQVYAVRRRVVTYVEEEGGRRKKEGVAVVVVEVVVEVSYLAWTGRPRQVRLSAVPMFRPPCSVPVGGYRT